MFSAEPFIERLYLDSWMSDVIGWQAIDAHSVRVIIHQQNVTASTEPHVNEQAQVTLLIAERYMEERG